jgi:uncharacterized membrane protein
MMTMHWGGLVAWFMMILGWIFIGWLVYRLFQSSSPGPDTRKNDLSPQEIAKKRYAAGEITSEEYHRIMSEIAD